MNTRIGTAPKNKWEIPKKTSMRRICDFKKVDITLSCECFPESYFDIVTTDFFQKKRKITRDKNLLNQKLPYCLNIYLVE